MIIYVFDKRIPGTPATSTRESVTDTRSVIVMADHSVQTTVNQIIRAAENERSIWLLRIVCHGRPGSLILGQGVDVGNAVLFEPLARYFTSGGRGIELHACNVASATSETMRVVDARDTTACGLDSCSRDRLGTPGHGVTGVGGEFMAALARATGVNVVGGYDLQFYDREYRFEGRGTMTVEPSGTTETIVAGTGG